MIDFEVVEGAGEDFWSDHEAQQIAAQIALFTAAEWPAFASELALRTPLVQERLVQILGDFSIEPAADVLLRFAASENREVALSAREALRGMDHSVVAAVARRLVIQKHLLVASPIEYGSTNEILDAIEAMPK